MRIQYTNRAGIVQHTRELLEHEVKEIKKSLKYLGHKKVKVVR